jgi:hypothetical protein
VREVVAIRSSVSSLAAGPQPANANRVSMPPKRCFLIIYFFFSSPPPRFYSVRCGTGFTARVRSSNLPSARPRFGLMLLVQAGRWQRDAGTTSSRTAAAICPQRDGPAWACAISASGSALSPGDSQLHEPTRPGQHGDWLCRNSAASRQSSVVSFLAR